MKRILSLFMIMTLIFAAFTSFTYADDNFDTILEEIEDTNDKIEYMIYESQMKADKLIISDSEDKEIEEELDEIINELISDTNELANEMIKEAKKAGINAVCELIKVEIGGREVWVDPIRVLTV